MDNNQSKLNQQKCIEVLQDIFKESSFSQRYSINSSSRKDWSNKSGYKDNRAIQCDVKPLNEDESIELDDIIKRVQSLYKSDQQLYQSLSNFKINKGMRKGDLFPSYSNVTDLQSLAKTDIQHQQGEVLLLDVWATWCGPCQIPMQHNQDMLEKNGELWGDKVRIIACSVDDTNEEALERIKEKKWDRMVHFRMDNGWDKSHTLMKDFQIKGIPFVVLIDQNGKINYIGHPTQIKLEQRIHSLLQENKITTLSSDQYKQGKKLLISQLSEYQKSQEDNKFTYSIVFQKTTIISQDLKEKVYDIPFYSVSVHQKYVDQYNKIQNFVSTTLGSSFPLLKFKEQIQDIKVEMKKDQQELMKIYGKYNLEDIETQHCVRMTLGLHENKLEYEKEEYLNVHKKYYIEKEANKDNINNAVLDQTNYIINKFQSDYYSDYLRKMYFKNIRLTHKMKDAPNNHEELYRKVKDLLQSKDLSELNFNIKLNYNPKFRIILKRHRVFDYRGEMKKKYYDQAVMKYSVRSTDLEALKKEISDKIYPQIDKDLLSLKENIIKVVSIEEGKVCKACNCELNVPYYFNYFQKEHYCIPCGDKRDSTDKTIKSFAVPHNLVLITTTEASILNDVDEYKLGKDAQPEADTEIDFKFGYSCNGCSSSTKPSRYICLTCNPGPYRDGGFVDFCHDCVQKQVFEKDQNFLEQIQKDDPCHNFNHIYLKVITPKGRYHNY